MSKKQSAGWNDLLCDLGLEVPKTAEIHEKEISESPRETANSPQMESPENSAEISWDAEPKKSWNLTDLFENAPVPPESTKPVEHGRSRGGVPKVEKQAASKSENPQSDSQAGLERFPKIDLFGPPPNDLQKRDISVFRHVTDDPDRLETVEHEATKEFAKNLSTRGTAAKPADPWSKLATQLGVLIRDSVENGDANESESTEFIHDKKHGDSGARTERGRRTPEDRGATPNRGRVTDREIGRTERNEGDPKNGKRRGSKPTCTTPDLSEKNLETVEPKRPVRGSRRFADGVVNDITHETSRSSDEFSDDSRFSESHEDVSSAKRSRRRRRRGSDRENAPERDGSDDDFSAEIQVPEPEMIDSAFDFEESSDFSGVEERSPASSRPRRGRGRRIDASSTPKSAENDDFDDVSARETGEFAAKPAEDRGPRKDRQRSAGTRGSRPSKTAMVPELEEEFDASEEFEMRQLHHGIPNWGDAVATVIEGNLARHAAKKPPRSGQRRR